MQDAARAAGGARPGGDRPILWRRLALAWALGPARHHRRPGAGQPARNARLPWPVPSWLCAPGIIAAGRLCPAAGPRCLPPGCPTRAWPARSKTYSPPQSAVRRATMTHIAPPDPARARFRRHMAVRSYSACGRMSWAIGAPRRTTGVCGLARSRSSIGVPDTIRAAGDPFRTAVAPGARRPADGAARIGPTCPHHCRPESPVRGRHRTAPSHKRRIALTRAILVAGSQHRRPPWTCLHDRRTLSRYFKQDRPPRPFRKEIDGVRTRAKSCLHQLPYD